MTDPKSVLVVTYRFPYPLFGGDKLRLYHLCRALSTRYRVVLAALCETEEEYRAEYDTDVFSEVHRVRRSRGEALVRAGLDVLRGRPLQCGYYYSGAFQRRVREVIQETGPDLVVAHLLRGAQYVLGEAASPVLVELTDSLSLAYRRVGKYGGWRPKEVLYRLERNRVAREEEYVLDRCDVATVVSEADCADLTERSDRGRVEVVGNGVDCGRFPYQGSGESRTVGFLGNMRASHNLRSCLYTAREVLPLLRERVPDATLKVVGAGPDRSLRELASIEGVEVTGRVESVQDELAECFACVCLMRYCSGIQNKILEYLALGKPTVANSMAVEGLRARDGKEILVRDSSTAAAEALHELNENRSRSARLGRSGRRYVEREHRWEDKEERFLEVAESALREQRGGSGSR